MRIENDIDICRVEYRFRPTPDGIVMYYKRWVNGKLKQKSKVLMGSTSIVEMEFMLPKLTKGQSRGSVDITSQTKIEVQKLTEAIH